MIFATADELFIQKVMPYGKPKIKDKVTVCEEGGFISLMLSAAETPFRTRLTIFAKMNGSTCLTIANDLRQKIKSTTLLGLGVLLTRHINGGFLD